MLRLANGAKCNFIFGAHFFPVTGAELANVLNEAALEAVRRGGSLITTEDVYNGMDRILQVPIRPCLGRPWMAHTQA